MLSDISKKMIITCILTGIVLTFLFYKQVIRKAVVNIDLQTKAKTTLKVYWSADDQPYSEKNMSKVTLTPGVTHYSIRICDLGKVSTLRIDTSDERISTVTVENISISQNGYQELKFSDVSSLAKWSAARGIKTLTNDSKGLTVIPADNDPQLIYPLPHLVYSPEYLANTLRLLVVFILACLFFWITHILCDRHDYVPYMLLFVLALIIVMAAISKYNQHPDEFVHIHAAEYYRDHTLPPKVGSPEIRNTYSPYGISRLDSGEIAYFFAGKFLKLLKPFSFPSYLTLRFFNILLFGSLFFLALYKQSVRVLFVPILISPQVWYIFSYFNSDAFALYLTLLAAYQLVVEKSMFNRVLREGTGGKNFLFFLILAFLFSLIVLSKINFYFFIVFSFLYLIWKMLFGDIELTKTFCLRLAAVAITGLVLAGCVRAEDVYVNGFNKKAQVEMYREKYAAPLYNPKTPLNKRHAYLQMRQRGVTLRELFVMDSWGEKTFESSFGVYGYTTVLAPDTYYNFVRICAAALLAVIILSTLFKGRLKGNALLVITLLCSFSLMGIDLYRSWTADFQPQGRYLLPIIAMLSVMLFHNEKFYLKSIYNLLIMGLFLLSSYSFIFIGLYGIEKYFL